MHASLAGNLTRTSGGSRNGALERWRRSYIRRSCRAMINGTLLATLDRNDEAEGIYEQHLSRIQSVDRPNTIWEYY